MGNADGSGLLSAANAFLIVQEGLGLVEPFVPDNPHISLTHAGGGVDPQFQIGENLPASVGGLVSVPVKLALEPGATNVGVIEFDLFFDASQLSIQVPAGISAGADTLGDWSVSSSLIAAGHLRVGIINSRGQPLAVGLREIAQLSFGVEAGVAEGLTVLDIEPVDPRADGYAWMADDGSILIGPTSPTADWNLRDHFLRDLEAEIPSLEGLLTDLADDIASAWRFHPQVGRVSGGPA